MKRSERGNALIITLMVIVGLLLLSLGVLTFTSNERAGGAAMRRREQLANCALAVRQYLGTQLRFPSAPAITNLNFTVPGTGGNVVIEGGHYNQPLPAVSGFIIGGGSAGGISTPVQELANNVRVNAGGSNLTGAATCTDADGNQYEVEFSFAFGLL